MWPDIVNGAFEVCGSLFITLNIRRVVIDKEMKGVSWLCVAFFTLWGFWNLFFYPHLGQWYSFAGGIAVVVTNTTWLVLLIYHTYVRPRPGTLRHFLKGRTDDDNT